MDKYQEYVLHTLQKPMRTTYGYIESDAFVPEEGVFHVKMRHIDIAEKILIKQDEDITITKYQLILVHEGIEAIYAIKQANQFPFNCLLTEYHWESKTNKDRKVFYYELDFDNKIDSIKIVFKDSIADALIIPIEFVDADKEAYYAKQEAKRIAELHRKAAISCATGQSLVNIYFQPCSEKYAGTEIVLYRDDFMIAKYTVEGELYFKPITNLAQGGYSFVLKQFSADGELLLETGHIGFSIDCPSDKIVTRKHYANQRFY